MRERELEGRLVELERRVSRQRAVPAALAAPIGCAGRAGSFHGSELVRAVRFAVVDGAGHVLAVLASYGTRSALLAPRCGARDDRREPCANESGGNLASCAAAEASAALTPAGVRRPFLRA